MNVDFVVSTPSGGLSLNTGAYKLASTSFDQESFTHRRSEVTSPFVEGTFVVNSLRENVTTNVSVWVTSETRAGLVAAVRVLCAVFDQTQFTAQLIIDGETQLWNCYASDYTVNTQHEFLHTSRARVDVQLVRDPNELGV